ncbi:MAG: hypothetical protein LAT81_05055 [Oceanicaulis sp.]|nr:hypothetical protein [Oceanicaulis sp.]
MSELLGEKSLALISKHKLKQEKELICAYENLTSYDVDTLIQYCYDAKDKEEAHLLLASLFTGRSMMELLDESIAVDEFVVGDFGVLSSSISHPKVPEFSNSKELDAPPNTSPYIFLSSSILRSVQSARGCKFEDYKTKLKSLVSEINKKDNARLTLGRIQRYFAKEAKGLNISQAEVGWISNTPLKNHAGSSYLSMSAGDLAIKHYTFINRLLESAGKQPFSLEALLSSPSAAKMMGSNRGLSNDDLKASLKNIRKSIDASRASLPATLWQLYNDYTHYTVSLLMVNTGHRPTRDPFGSLSNFGYLQYKVGFYLSS